MTDHSVAADLHVVEILQELLDAGHVVLISRYPGAGGEYSGSAGSKRHCTSPTLEGCLEGLTSNPRMKICIRENCTAQGRPRPLSCFGPDPDSRDGHGSACRECENARIKAHQQKKRSAAAASHQDKASEAFG